VSTAFAAAPYFWLTMLALAVVTTFLAWVTEHAPDPLAAERARDFDAHVDQALAVAEPTPIGDSVARDLGDLWAVETVDDCVWLWGDRRP
jgi:hypothetical protein